jgi:hypothetical protein
MSLNPQQEKILTAFVTALAQQDDSLPSALQKQLNAIGQNLEGRVVELPTIAANLPSLNQAYQVALSNTQTDKGEPRRNIHFYESGSQPQTSRTRCPNSHRFRLGSSCSTKPTSRIRANCHKPTQALLSQRLGKKQTDNQRILSRGY